MRTENYCTYLQNETFQGRSCQIFCVQCDSQEKYISLMHMYSASMKSHQVLKLNSFHLATRENFSIMLNVILLVSRTVSEQFLVLAHLSSLSLFAGAKMNFNQFSERKLSKDHFVFFVRKCNTVPTKIQIFRSHNIKYGTFK